MKKIKKILLFTHEKYLKNKEIQKITSFLKRNKVVVELVFQSDLGIEIISSGDVIKNTTSIKKSTLKSYELIIVFGGDGLFLSASKIAYTLEIPILGVNFGKIGFLVDVDKKDILEKVSEIIAH